VITHADRAHIGAAAASTGATVYDGDRLSTDARGAMRLTIFDATLHLEPQTTLSVRHTNDPARSAVVELLAGILAFSAARSATVSILADNATIRPATDAPTLAYVRIVNQRELRISAQRGALRFSYGGETEIVAEGTAYRVLLDPAENPPDQPRPPARRRRAFIFIAIGAALLIAVPITVHLLESEDNPSRGVKAN
jgi:hypothetical protein